MSRASVPERSKLVAGGTSSSFVSHRGTARATSGGLETLMEPPGDYPLTRTHGCTESHHAWRGRLFITSSPRDEWSVWKTLMSNTEKSYPLLLRGHKGLEARGHTEAQLVDKRRLRLAVDLHSHTCLKRCVLCMEDKKTTD